MTDRMIEQMNAQHALIGDALQAAIAKTLHDYPDIPHEVAVTALIDIAVASGKLAGLSLELIKHRITTVYDAA